MWKRHTASAHSSASGEGPPSDESRLVAGVYDQLRRLAHRNLEHEATGHTFTTTDLAHQAYLRLASQDRTVWRNESHFMAIAAAAMRRILVDHARTHHRFKRGGGRVPVSLDTAHVAAEERAELLVALDEALDQLRRVDARQARVVECRFFAGMNEVETAKALGVSVRTARRDWMKAKAWLYDEICDS
jgi:RNA polymerase sigma factor (TIGR02999 family)